MRKVVLAGAVLLLWAPHVWAQSSYNPMLGAQSRQESGLVALPHDLAFGELSLEQDGAAARQVVLRNSTAAPLHLRFPEPSDSALNVGRGDCGEVLEQDRTCSAIISWTPLQPGKLDATIITSSEAGDLDIHVTGMAKGYAGVNLRSSATRGVLGTSNPSMDLGKTSGATAITLFNSGSRQLTLGKISLGTDRGHDNSLVLGGDCLEKISGHIPMASGDACTVVVAWDGSGHVRDTLVIHHDGVRGVTAVPLLGGSDDGRDQVPPANPGGIATLPMPPANALPSSPPVLEKAPRIAASAVGPVLMGMGSRSILVSINGQTMPLSIGGEAGGWRLVAMDKSASCVDIERHEGGKPVRQHICL